MNTLSIIGAGNMGFAIASGLVKSGQYQPQDIYLSTVDQNAADNFKKMGFNVGDNIELVKQSEVVLLVVKPWQAVEVLDQVSPYVTDKHMIASCVTGLTSDDAFAALKRRVPYFRVMPNTGAMVGESMTCIADVDANDAQKSLVETIFKTLGQVLFITEDKMAAGTAMAGCGIAFALRFIRAATECGVEIGIPAKESAVMAAQIAKGAAELILQNESNPEVEIDKVTTPGGVTIAGLNAMEHAGFSSSVIKGIMAAYKKQF